LANAILQLRKRRTQRKKAKKIMEKERGKKTRIRKEKLRNKESL